uniref:CLIP domain-containing serine protease n=1 Tax=Helicoverpa armigera TaxID=29058 RepID=A0A290U615_HELAM|nr:phenoloxidase-activating enzyme 1 isoform X1 [Helicoverpa armigera]ATD13324.1 csp8 [Helicoverpa armigera]
MWFSSVFFVSTLIWSNVYSQSSCVTPLGKTSNCVSLYDCSALLTAFEQRPLPNSVVSFLRRSQCGFEGYVPRVCCGPLPPDENVQPTPRPTPRPTQAPTEGSSEVFQEDSSPAPRNQCGVDTNGDRIYGGTFTDLDEFPWMALLGYLTRKGTTSYQCGGVLINHRYVLTAAHCIKGAIETEVGSLKTVRLGEYDTQQDVDCVDSVCADSPQEIRVASAYAHPGYIDKNKSRRDDIGIVRMAGRARYTYYVQPICLVDNRVRLDTGNDVHVAGWGKTLNGRNSPVKLKLTLPIFDKDDCVSKYRTLGAMLGDNQICAGGVFAEDACRGDSGGPLMKRRPEGIWEAVGVVSFGYGCGRDGWPGVYTSVAGYIDWIKTTLQNTNV